MHVQRLHSVGAAVDDDGVLAGAVDEATAVDETAAGPDTEK